jgi:hypothetical protein
MVLEQFVAGRRDVTQTLRRRLLRRRPNSPSLTAASCAPRAVPTLYAQDPPPSVVCELATATHAHSAPIHQPNPPQFLRARLGISGMKWNEWHWSGGISIISQNFPKSPSILFHPLESSIFQTSPQANPNHLHKKLTNHRLYSLEPSKAPVVAYTARD